MVIPAPIEGVHGKFVAGTLARVLSCFVGPLCASKLSHAESLGTRESEFADWVQALEC